MSDSLQPHGLLPIRLLQPWDFPGKSTGVGCHCLLRLLGSTKYLIPTTHAYIRLGTWILELDLWVKIRAHLLVAVPFHTAILICVEHIAFSDKVPLKLQA